MSTTSPICPRCGTVNPSTLNVCWKCGASLTTTPTSPAPYQSPSVPSQTPPSPIQPQPATQATTLPPYPPPTALTQALPSPYPPTTTSTFYQDMMEAKRRKEIGQTKNGVLLIVIGLLVASLANLAILIGAAAGIFGLGGLVALIGGVLVILGRSTFGKEHSRNVLICIGLFIANIVVGIIGGAILAFYTISFGLNTQVDRVAAANAIQIGLNIFLVATIIASILGGLAQVLLTYALQRPTGRLLLWLGFASSLVITATIFVLTFSGINDAIQRALATGTYDPGPIDALQSQTSTIQLFSFIPTVLIATAFYLAWDRINRGELPAPVSGIPTIPAYPPSPVP